MEPFVIRSARDSTELRLGPPDQVGGFSYRADLCSGVVNASVEVYDLEPSTLVRFMESVARDWRGWVGKKTWKSLEGHIGLECECDSLGHVFIPVRLRDGFGVQDWLAEGTLFVEAGQLSALANACQRVFGIQTAG